MSSKISTRSSGAVTTAAPVLVGAQRHRPLVREHVPPSPYTSRRVPTTGYRVDKVVNQNGKTTEVITIDDTPPPTASGSGSHYDSSSRQAYEPLPKKRRNEGHTNGYGSDQPSGSSSHRNGNVAGTQDRYAASGSGSGSGSRAVATGAKRKRDPYEGYGRREGSGGRDSTNSRSVPKVSKAQDPIKDKDGHYIVREGGMLTRRYRIVRSLGQGTFGKVVCAYDEVEGVERAVKVIRAVLKYQEASKVEVRVLQLLGDKDPYNRHNCIHLLDCFEHHGHVCIVSELLSSSVFDFLKDNQYQPFPFKHIHDFARQLLDSVKFLHSLDLIHTDLKPENILLEDVSSNIVVQANKKTKKELLSSKIRLIDFGSATFEHDHHANVVSTRHYRAPEIILGMSWSFPCDAWSIGCILIEFFTGEALFQTHENVEHLAMMRKVFGEMPPSFIARANEIHPEMFRKEKGRPLALDFPNATTSKQSKKFVNQMRSLKDLILGPNDGNIAVERFYDLLTKLLAWEPEKRISVKDALEHPFIRLYTTEPRKY